MIIERGSKANHFPSFDSDILSMFVKYIIVVDIVEKANVYVNPRPSEWQF